MKISKTFVILLFFSSTIISCDKENDTAKLYKNEEPKIEYLSDTGDEVNKPEEKDDGE